MKAKFAILKKLKSPLKIVNLEIPNLSEGQILVKMSYTSICRSQIMEIDGMRGKDKWIPHLLGHEGSGIVIKKGKGVKYFKIGDRVLVTWISTEGIKAKGPKFNYKQEIIHSGSSTTFSQFSIVSEDKLIKLPEFLDLKKASFFGCAVPTGFGMVLNEINQRKKEKKILIIGLGGIGVSTLICLKILKFLDVSVLESNQDKINQLKKNKNFNHIKAFNYSNDIKKNDYDYVLECAGSVKTIQLAFKFINYSGKVIFASHPKFKSKISIDPHELIKGKKNNWHLGRGN